MTKAKSEKELYNLSVEETETNPAYQIEEEIHEVPIPGFEDTLKRSTYVLYFDGDEEGLKFVALREAKKRATKKVRDWQRENGIVVSANSNLANPDTIQRKLVKDHGRMIINLHQSKEAGLNKKVIKKIDRVVETLSSVLEEMEQITNVSNESIVESIEAHKQKLRDSRKKAVQEETE